MDTTTSLGLVSLPYNPLEKKMCKFILKALLQNDFNHFTLHWNYTTLAPIPIQNGMSLIMVIPSRNL